MAPLKWEENHKITNLSNISVESIVFGNADRNYWIAEMNSDARDTVCAPLVRLSSKPIKSINITILSQIMKSRFHHFHNGFPNQYQQCTYNNGFHFVYLPAHILYICVQLIISDKQVITQKTRQTQRTF